MHRTLCHRDRGRITFGSHDVLYNGRPLENWSEDRREIYQQGAKVQTKVLYGLVQSVSLTSL